MVLLNLRAQILISLNARLFKVFNLRDNKVFTISLLKNILGSSFHVPEHLIQFTLVSGRYTKDSDALVDLRASDGNFASLDVGVLPPHYCSSLSEAIVSFEFRANPTPTYLDGVSVAGIQEIPLMYQTLRPVSDRLNNELNNLNISNKKLTKDQRIALRARYEDPFSISSKSCFEEDSDDDSLYEDEDSESELGDSDDDLYSDDEVESTGFTESRSAFSNYEACHKADSVST
ncbi:expressed protein [Phakopsora pachyrhizi]|uniref:Expressed protein n=1 Tax=Phakopsora pachyrhizi TaxID=170000 RepID=A0AAV0AIB4_PHAPC|nr:expressed protein [Phakopsora pachyrhizi]